MSAPVVEAELQAWVDGCLPAARRAAVDAYLARHPDQAARLQAYRQQNAALRARYNPVLDEAVPAALAARPHGILWQAARAALAANGPWRHVAALALTLAGGAAGWWLHDIQAGGAAAPPALAGAARAQPTPARPGSASGGPAAQLAAADGPPTAEGQALARSAAVAHAVYSPEQRHPVEVGADQQQHLVTWLSKRLGAPLHPPQLGALGYTLIGGRLLPGQSGPVAQFMYDNAGGKRLTLYVSTEQRHNNSTAFRFAQEGQVGVFYWIDGRYGYALSGALDRTALARLADAVYVQLEPPG
ncbi:anti-sigma factor family protein [Rugamonas apoptosis]|uniref:Anti-sigma factor n=1 Tax=Rugamonas apoptosis TaxID=2758570 RepID=A0A7W2IIM7_9BURK|nr:anti-sigma factor [Rugamonas apoptosis]MBA5685472.1 anti-sigma factor [Rugamonas apoptosis]